METWLPVNDNYTEGVNVADQQFDPDSMLNFYKRMLAMRKRTPALVAGDYTVLHKEAEDYIAFLRSTPEQTCLVVLNFSKNAQTLTLDMDRDIARLVFSSEEREGVGNVAELAIAPFEIYIAGLA